MMRLFAGRILLAESPRRRFPANDMLRACKILPFLLIAALVGACVPNYGPKGLRELGILSAVRAGDKYRFSTFPSSLTIPIPQTLSAQTLATQTGAVASPYHQSVTSCSAQSFGYQEIRFLVDNFRQVAKEAYRELMLLDGVVSKVRAGYPQNTCVDGGTYAIEWTAEMRESMFNAITDAGLSADLAEDIVLELEQSGYIPRVGDDIPSPAMVYRSNQGGYSHELRYEFSPDGIFEPQTCAEAAGEYDTTIRWNEARTKFQLNYQENFEGNTFSGSLTVDLSANTMFFREAYDFGGDRFSRTASMQSCTTGPDCVLVEMTQMMNMSGMDFQYKLDGKADDNGGYIRTVYTYEPGPTTDYYREYFSSGGNIIGMQYSSDDTTYTSMPGCESYDYAGDDYYTGTDVNVGVTVNVSSTGCGGDCIFVIVPDGVDPNSSPESVIGSGGDIGGSLFVDYWGATGTELNDADIWMLTGYDAEGFPTYSVGNTTNGNLSGS